MKVRVKPAYGYGWYTAAMQMSEVPPAFSVDLEIIDPDSPFRAAMGLVAERDHLLTGLWVVLQQRTSGNEHTYNLDAYKEKPQFEGMQTPAITGFAMVAPNSN